MLTKGELYVCDKEGGAPKNHKIRPLLFAMYNYNQLHRFFLHQILYE